MMNTIKLTVGDFVKLADGTICIVLANADDSTGLSLFTSKNYGKCKSFLSRYNDDLCHDKKEAKDIVAVFKGSEPHADVPMSQVMADFYNGDLCADDLPWDFEKVDPADEPADAVKEVTMAEAKAMLEQLLGVKITG